MEKKINIAELLKDCPQGMELDCTMYEDCKFLDVEAEGNRYLLRITTPCGIKYLDKYGCYTTSDKAKCVIFPKGKTTWEGFVPPCKFNDGDILATDLGSVFYLNTRLNTDEYYGCYVGIGSDGSFHICEPFAYKECCGLSTEEEKQKLFDVIKENGYEWNAETKTLDKLVEPKFKVGDRVKSIYNNNQYDIIGLTDTHYTLVEIENKFKYTEPIIEDKNWELVPKKFDITTLKPFDKVLARAHDADSWACNLYSHHIKDYYFVLNAELAPQCIPYEGNEHLLGKTDDCDEYYKSWK